jgi:hypothetical protein
LIIGRFFINNVNRFADILLDSCPLKVAALSDAIFVSSVIEYIRKYMTTDYLQHTFPWDVFVRSSCNLSVSKWRDESDAWMLTIRHSADIADAKTDYRTELSVIKKSIIIVMDYNSNMAALIKLIQS